MDHEIFSGLTMCYRAGVSRRELVMEGERKRLELTGERTAVTERNLKRERERASKYNLVDMLSSICLPYASCSLHGFPPTHGQGQTPTACTPPHRIHTAKQRHFTKINYQNNQPSSPHFTEAISGKPVSLTNYIHPTPALSLPLVAVPHPSTHPLF